MALAVAAAYVESKARLTASLAEVSAGARLTLALTAPFRYLWRTLVPVNLTPLDPLAVTPHADVTLIVASAITLAAISWMAWRWRGPYPGMAAAWLSYIALLVPAVGLVPSGLQATADRYTYLAAVPVSIDVPSRSIRRTHAQAALGMALVQIGRTSHAMPYLREAIRQGAAEPSVPNALAFSLVKEGRAREACDVLEAARARFPGDANVARNLAQLSAECGKP